MPAIICGSLAFDSIMNFGGRFADQILPDQIHKLNVSFYVPQLRRDFGGCAGNMAYALKQLGGEPIIVAALGNDGQSYLDYLQGEGIPTQCITLRDDIYTAQAMIMTDTDNNQITAFHPGAMQLAHLCRLPCAATAKDIGIVGPDGRDAMLQHAQNFALRCIPFIFDPGQGLPMFDGPELLNFVQQATWVAVNDYEAELLRERTGLSLAEIASQVRGLVVTLGADGCDVYENGQCQRVAPVQAQAVLDPTGCGDAFRGGLLYGLERGWSLARSAALGNRLGAIKIAHQGPQGYALDAAAVLAQV